MRNSEPLPPPPPYPPLKGVRTRRRIPQMPAPRDRKPRPPWKFTPLRVTETKGRGHLARGSRFGTGGKA